MAEILAGGVIQFTDLAGSPVILADPEFMTEGEERELVMRCRPAERQELAGILRALRARTLAMHAVASAAQRAIGAGGCYVRRFPGNQVFPPALIYGRVMTAGQIIAREIAHGASMAEAADDVARIAQGSPVGWRWVLAHSAATPEGEAGWEHVANMTPIGAWTFAAAATLGWPAELAPALRPGGRPAAGPTPTGGSSPCR